MNTHPLANKRLDETADQYVTRCANMDRHEARGSRLALSRVGSLSAPSSLDAMPPQPAPAPAKIEHVFRVVAFDYASIDPDIAVMALKIVNDIHARHKNYQIDTGRDLLAVKAKMPHGKFGVWLDAEFGMTSRTAENYMNASQFLEGKSETVSYLRPAILYALASPSADINIVNEVIAEVDAGKTVLTAEIRERLAGATKARLAAESVRTAEQIKKDRDNAKRRRVTEEKRLKEEKVYLDGNKAALLAKSEKVASFLIDHLSRDDIAELRALMTYVQWSQVVQSIDKKTVSTTPPESLGYLGEATQ